MDVCRKYLVDGDIFLCCFVVYKKCTRTYTVLLSLFPFPFDSAAEKYCCPHLDDSNVASRYVIIICFVYCTLGRVFSLDSIVF